MLVSATIVSLGVVLPGDSYQVTAWRKLESEVAKLRPLIAPSRCYTTASASDEALRIRIAELDDALDTKASSSDGIGAGWMWTPAHHDELYSIVRDARPELDELAQIAEQRGAIAPLPFAPRLGCVRHRVNLLCASALVETDDLRARERFRQAWQVATMEDDGGSWASRFQLGLAGILAQAVRMRSEATGTHDKVLEDELTSAFEQLRSCDAFVHRCARDLVDMVDRADRSKFEHWYVQTMLRAASALNAALAGQMSAEDLRRRDEEQDLRLFLWICDPNFRETAGQHLRL